MNGENPYEDLFSPEDMAKFLGLWDRRWIMVDPTTKKPHKLSEEFFWQVTHMYPGVKVGGDMNHPEMQFQLQRFYRNKTYKRAILDEGGKAVGELPTNVAWHETTSRGELKSPGTITKEFSSFGKELVEDGRFELSTK